MTFVDKYIEFASPDNVKSMSIEEANKYLKNIQEQSSIKLTNEQFKVLQNSFTAGYKTAFINLLQYFENPGI